jgi:hypothetical protein
MLPALAKIKINSKFFKYHLLPPAPTLVYQQLRPHFPFFPGFEISGKSLKLQLIMFQFQTNASPMVFCENINKFYYKFSKIIMEKQIILPLFAIKSAVACQ